MRFIWDAAKSVANVENHGVSLDEASELFKSGEDYLELYDETHSTFEDRFLAIGPIRRGLVLVVWTERREDEVRIISARWASPREARLYERFREGG